MWFLLIWGKQQYEKRLGFVADFCSACRQVSSFEVLEHRQGPHFWFIPIGRSTPTGTTMVCGSCGIASVFPSGRFTHLARSARGSLEKLVEGTFPNLRQYHHEQLEIAKRIADGSLDADLRHQLTKAAFGIADRHYSAGRTHLAQRILTLQLRSLRPTEEEIAAGLQPYRGTINRMGALATETVMVWIYPELEKKDPNKFNY